jgi:hypothetical protein
MIANPAKIAGTHATALAQVRAVIAFMGEFPRPESSCYRGPFSFPWLVTTPSRLRLVLALGLRRSRKDCLTAAVACAGASSAHQLGQLRDIGSDASRLVTRESLEKTVRPADTGQLAP